MNMFQHLAEWLEGRGIGSYLQSPEQLVVSSENPALPTSNCFWVRKKNGEWYIGTWLVAAYHVPPSQEIGRACELVYRSSSKAMYTIDSLLAERLELRRLTDEEMEELGFT